MSRIRNIADGVIVDGFERLIRVVDGYDCWQRHDSTLEPAPRCVPGSGGNHGCHGDEVHVIVRYEDGRAAVNLFLQTGDLRGAKDALGFGSDYPKAQNLLLHAPFIVNREALADNSGWDACDYIAGGRCQVAGSSYTRAERLYAEHVPAGADVREVPEALWVALTAYLVEQYAKALEERVDEKFEVCPTCAGERTAPKLLAEPFSYAVDSRGGVAVSAQAYGPNIFIAASRELAADRLEATARSIRADIAMAHAEYAVSIRHELDTALARGTTSVRFTAHLDIVRRVADEAGWDPVASAPGTPGLTVTSSASSVPK